MTLVIYFRFNVSHFSLCFLESVIFKTMNYLNFLLAIIFSVYLVDVNAQDITGIWETYDDETGELKSEVKIYEKEGKIYGKIIELHNLKVNTNNPICIDCEDYRKDKPVRGMVIITGLVKDEDEWSADDAILDPNNGEIYDCKIWLINENKLAVRGYIGWFYRTQYWKRASD